MGKIEKLIGLKVKNLRERAGLTQIELAEKAKISETTVNRLEKGRQLPHSDTLDLILTKLGSSAEEVMGLQDRASKSDMLTLIYSRLPALDERQLTLVLDVLENMPSLFDDVGSPSLTAALPNFPKMKKNK